MLDIKLLREHPDLVRADLEKRRETEKLAWVDDVLEKDAAWRRLKGECDELRAKRNSLSEQVNTTKKKGGDTRSLIAEVKAIPSRIAALEDSMMALQGGIRHHLMRLPNLMHEDVPYGKDDTENTVVATFGKKPSFKFPPRNHTELIMQLGIVDLERAAKVSGSRFSFLTGDLALLEMALAQHGIRFLAERGYMPVFPPHLLNRAAYEGVTDLGAFEDMLYKIEGEDLYLIATSEHPLTAQFQDEVIDARLLPARLVGYSPCYRKEAGSHGKEEKGIWRVHQFNKVEQVVISKPDESWAMHEEITRNAIDFFQSLGLHFRQVLICTGDLGIVAAKKYDLEAWIPSVGAYKEIVSSSNCTAYQAVRLNIRCQDGASRGWVHTLNSTLVATSRALVAILEQNQQDDGSVLIPEVLRPYLGGKAKIEPACKA